MTQLFIPKCAQITEKKLVAVLDYIIDQVLYEPFHLKEKKLHHPF